MGSSCLPRGRSDVHICGALSAKGGGRPPPGLLSKIVRGSVAQRGMRSSGVVQAAIAVQNDTGVPRRVEHLQIQTLLPQPRVETLSEAVLPNGSREASPLDHGFPGRMNRVPTS